MTHMSNPLASMPGMDQWRKQQEAFLNTMMGGWRSAGSSPEPEAAVAPEPEAEPAKGTELDEIKRQLAALQKQLEAKG